MTTLEAPPEVAVGQRRPALDERVTLVHVAGVFTFASALASGALAWVANGHVPGRAPIYATAAVAALLAACAIRTGRRALWLSALGCLAPVALGLGRAIFSKHGLDAPRLLQAAVLVSWVAIAAVLLLVATRRVKPLHAGLLVASLAGTFLASEVWDELRAPTPITAAATATPQSDLDDQGLLDEESLATPTKEFPHRPPQPWPHRIGPAAVLDPLLGYVLRPYAVLKDVYPDNPRGYFHDEPVYGPIEPRAMQLDTHDGGQAQLSYLPEGRGVRVDVRTLPKESPWGITLRTSQFPLVAGHDYLIAFRARADRKRNVQIKVLPEVPPSYNLGLIQDVTLEPEWQQFMLRLRALADEPMAVVEFVLGNEIVAVELETLSVAPIEQNPGTLDPRFWQLRLDPGAAGELQLPTTTEGTLTAAIGAADPKKPWIVRIEQSVDGVKKGEQVTLRLRAKADRLRPLEILLATGKPKFTRLCHTQSVQLGTEWREHVLTIPVFGSAATTHVVINLASAEGAVELGAAHLESNATRAAPPRTPHEPPRRAFVRYDLNSAGFRDVERTAEPAAGTFRIACLGDSYTYGQGVHYDDIFSVQLERLLNERLGQQGLHCEVLNFGLKGYTTRQERVCYEQVASKYAPQLVLVTMVHNDNSEYLEEIKTREKPATGLAKVFRNLQRVEQVTAADEDYTVCVENLLELNQRVESDGARLAVALFGDGAHDAWATFRRQVTGGLAGKGIPLLDLNERLAREPRNTMIVHPLDPHPSERAHAIAAEELAAFLLRERLVFPSSPTPP